MSVKIQNYTQTKTDLGEFQYLVKLLHIRLEKMNKEGHSSLLPISSLILGIYMISLL